MSKAMFNRIKRLVILLVSSWIVWNAPGYALPFNINLKAGTQLPTSVSAGSTVTAYYTVFNNTQSQRNNNTVQWLPSNVRQVISAGTFVDTCGATFNLAPKGQSGDSCTLQLTISGAVNANNADPHQHLFVCFPGGTTCAGTLSPLSVTLLGGAAITSITIAPASIAEGNPDSNINASIGINATKQYTATGHYANNTTADVTSLVNWSSSATNIATVGTGSQDNGLVTANTTGGPTTISASISGVSAQVQVNVVPYAYAVSFNTGSGITYQCSINNLNQIDTCTSTTHSPSHPWGIGANPAAPSVYISDSGGGFVGSENVQVCPVADSGNILSCADANYTNVLQGQPAAFIAVNPTGTIAYLSNANGPGEVAYCNINTQDGTFSSCHTLCGGGSAYCGGRGIALSPDNQWAYINGTASGNGVIYACPINHDGTFGSCSLAYTTPTADPLLALAINADGTTLYATNASNNSSSINIYTCTIATPGQIATCVAASQSFQASTPNGIALNPQGNYAYTTSNATGTNSFCSAPVSGLTSCIAPMSPSSFTQLRGIATF